MTNFKLLITSLAISITISSCSWETKSESSTTISYSGKIVFSDDKTRITSISPHGFLIFETNGDKLRVENDLHDRVVYQVNDGDKEYSLSDKGKSLFDRAVQQLVSDSTIKAKPYIINNTEK